MPTIAPRRPSAGADISASARQYDTWTAWVDSGDWRTSESTATLALPGNASDIMVLALDPDVSISQLVQLVSRDQVLAARMLRLANSAYCAPLEAITTISDAVVRLGTTSVRNVILATCMASRLQQGSSYGPQGRGLADHGIGAAFLSQVVAKLAGVNAEQAFLCGLVHDLGKLLLLQLSRAYTTAGGRWVRPEELAEVAARCHAEIGGLLLTEWRLPPVIHRPVVFHHEPDACLDYPLQAAVVYAANRLAHRYGFGCKPSPDEDVLADAVLVRLGITPGWLEAMDAQAPEMMQVGAAAFA